MQYTLNENWNFGSDRFTENTGELPFESRGDLPTRTRLRLWILDLFVWDGLLQLVMVTIPVVLAIVVTNSDFFTWLPLVTTTMAFLIRLCAGARFLHLQKFRSNQGRMVLFGMGLVSLAIIDCVCACVAMFPNPQDSQAFVIIVPIAYLVYLLLVAVATLPFGYDLRVPRRI